MEDDSVLSRLTSVVQNLHPGSDLHQCRKPPRERFHAGNRCPGSHRLQQNIQKRIMAEDIIKD